MELSTFLLSVLGIYTLYYAALFAYDRMRLRTQGASQPSSHHVYRLEGAGQPAMHGSSGIGRREGDNDGDGFTGPDAGTSREDEDSDLGIEYISDDGIEVVDERLEEHFRTVKNF
jgi:hypothetical protein